MDEYATNAQPDLLAAIAATTVEGTAEVVFARGIDRVLVYLNPACEQLTGWSSAKVVGRKCHKVFGDGLCPADGPCPPEAALRARRSKSLPKMERQRAK